MGSSSYFCNTYGKHNDAVERDRAHHPPTRPNKKINNRTKSSRNFAKVFAINGLLVMIVRGSHGVTVSRFEAAVLNLCLCQIYVISYVCLLLRVVLHVVFLAYLAMYFHCAHRLCDCEAT